jgi:stage V sporulation protein R
MKQDELRRLMKIEERIYQIVVDEMGLKCDPVEFDIVSPIKMLEIMAYRCPTNISNWKYGRDFERYRTIFDNYDPNLPYEVVINDNPCRAYLMNTNTLAIQALVIAHVYGHVNFFTESKWYKNSRNDIMALLSEAGRRFNQYERLYGRDEVEKIEDAAHALQFHSVPFDQESEDEKRMRIFEQEKLMNKSDISEFRDIIKLKKPGENIEAFNIKLWRYLKSKTPVEPQPDILRYIIDNSNVLDDWQKDILEILRIEGQYFWPHMRTRFMNEGWAVFTHQRVMSQLFKEGLLSEEEHGQYNHSNSLVKAENPLSLNPYLVGTRIYEDIYERWEKGRFGEEWNECKDEKKKSEWDTGAHQGFEKVRNVMRSYIDWFFFHEFLTLELVDELKMYIYIKSLLSLPDGTPIIEDNIIADLSDEEIKDIIIRSFANNGIPLIEIVDGNHNNQSIIMLEHRWNGLALDIQSAINTLKHIYNLWGQYIILKTKVKIDDDNTKTNNLILTYPIDDNIVGYVKSWVKKTPESVLGKEKSIILSKSGWVSI